MCVCMCVPVPVCAFYPTFFLPDLKRNPVADKKYWREKLSDARPVLECPLCALPKPNITCFPCHVPHAISRRHDQFAITVLRISNFVPFFFFLFDYYHYCYYYLHLPLTRFLRETAAALAAPNNPALLPIAPCPARGRGAWAASAEQRGAARSPVLGNCGNDCTK